MNTETTGSKTPVQRFVMRRSGRQLVRAVIRGCARFGGMLSVLFNLAVFVLLVAYIVHDWEQPGVRIGVYLLGMFVTLVLFGCKWFEELRDWSEQSDA